MSSLQKDTLSYRLETDQVTKSGIKTGDLETILFQLRLTGKALEFLLSCDQSG